jgi:hypothetical protein
MKCWGSRRNPPPQFDRQPMSKWIKRQPQRVRISAIYVTSIATSSDTSLPAEKKFDNNWITIRHQAGRARDIVFPLEGFYMRPTFKALVLSSATLCATASFAASLARVNVPFNFTAKGQSFPAGEYAVSMDSHQGFVTLANYEDAGKQISWVVGPAEAADKFAVIKFDVMGPDYALKTIQLGDKITPNLDPNPKRGISATTSIGGQ